MFIHYSPYNATCKIGIHFIMVCTKLFFVIHSVFACYTIKALLGVCVSVVSFLQNP
jgi:hypothetical protein